MCEPPREKNVPSIYRGAHFSKGDVIVVILLSEVKRQMFKNYD